ncbi:hypothetical protein HG426_001420 [Candidatus Saccharibacteria bacterium]|nr:hypothetical protein [Candidatus Saccharibacteria bacterium]
MLCSAIFSVIAVVAAYQLKVMRMFVALGTLFSFDYLYTTTVALSAMVNLPAEFPLDGFDELVYKADAWMALICFILATIVAVDRKRPRVLAWISRLWIRRAQTDRISALVKMAQLSLTEQARGPREGYPPESPDDA